VHNHGAHKSEYWKTAHCYTTVIILKITEETWRL